MIYDCIPFFNEVDILKLRLHILDPYVDRFVIEEATTTFSGEPKELCFEKNKEQFREFLPKIDYIVVDEDRDFRITHERDYFQKNHLIQGLKDAADTDIILFGDCDEIPNPEALTKILDSFDPEKVYHLAQNNYYVFLNNLETAGKLLSITGEFPDIPAGQRKWLGTKACSLRSIPEEGIVRLRDLVPVTDPRSVRVADGGWHFGYMGGDHETDVLSRIGAKVKAAAHQEYNDSEILRETMDHVILGQDIFGRDSGFTRVEIDGTYPEYLRNHLDEYRYLVLPPVTPWVHFTHKLDITAGRFVRRAVHHVQRKFRSSPQSRQNG